MQDIYQRIKQNTLQIKILLSIVLFATLTRIAIPSFIDHPPNFSAIDAIALLCGAYCSRRSIALIVVIFSVLIGDIFLNKILLGQWSPFYSGFYWQYASYGLITCLGATLKNNVQPLRLISTCLVSAILFFGLSNFGVWFSGLLYPLTLNGLIACYVAAIPFFKHTLFSDLLFTLFLFGIFELIKINVPKFGLSNSMVKQKFLKL